MSRWTLLLVLFGCSGDPPPSSDAPPTPDAGPCLGTNTTCNGDVLAVCAAAGATPIEEICSWGCTVDPSPACDRLVPTGGGATAADVMPAGLAGLAELGLSGTIDGSTGRINGIAAATMNVDYALVNGIGVFRFKRLAIGGLKLVTGTVPVQLISDGVLTVDGTIDATGGCGVGAPDLAGAGGGNGGQTSGADGALIGGGAGGASQGLGGGAGGGWGGTGGTSGGGELGGIAAGDPQVTILRGGSGGGAGVGVTTFQGGGGGGAIHLISNTRIEIAVAGNINAGGCGGRKGTDATDEGGGGGAGGTIVLEAPEVSLAAGRVLAVNGGGGGGGGGTDGGAGQLSRNAAVGGNAGANGGAGGAGAAGAAIDGTAGGAGTRPGGGGGAAGRIRINTRTGAATIAGVMSPALDDPGTTATQGTAALQ